MGPTHPQESTLWIPLDRGQKIDECPATGIEKDRSYAPGRPFVGIPRDRNRREDGRDEDGRERNDGSIEQGGSRGGCPSLFVPAESPLDVDLSATCRSLAGDLLTRPKAGAGTWEIGRFPPFWASKGAGRTRRHRRSAAHPAREVGRDGARLCSRRRDWVEHGNARVVKPAPKPTTPPSRAFTGLARALLYRETSKECGGREAARRLRTINTSLSFYLIPYWRTRCYGLVS